MQVTEAFKYAQDVRPLHDPRVFCAAGWPTRWATSNLPTSTTRKSEASADSGVVYQGFKVNNCR
eukprot:766513-Hanusia_phi.AAC.8